MSMNMRKSLKLRVWLALRKFAFWGSLLLAMIILHYFGAI